MQLGCFEMRNFIIDYFYKEKINKKHFVNLQLGLFEMRNFITDCFYKEKINKKLHHRLLL